MSPRSAGEPIAALLTPRGRGAIATVAYLGDCRRIDEAQPPLFRAADGRPLATQHIGRIVFGHWGTEPAEEVVVCRTAENQVEIHCHGGDAAARRVLDGLAAAGARVVFWRDFSARVHGRFQAECLEVLARATTERTAQLLLEQQAGLLQTTLEQLLAAIVAAETPARAFATSVPEHDDSNRSGPPEPVRLVDRIDALLRWAEFGVHLSEPWNVVIAGRPNVGKSSLLNALVGYGRSIVYDQPGTTRDVVTVETAFEGWPIQLADTAGFRQAAEPLEAAGIERASGMLNRADCRILLIDASMPLTEDDQRLLAMWPDGLVVANKIDLGNVAGPQLPPAALAVSSLTGQGLSALASAIVRRLVPAVPPPGTAVPITRRQVKALSEARSTLMAGDVAGCRAILETLLA